MKGNRGKPEAKEPAGLRKRAERLLSRRAKPGQETAAGDTAKLIHELRVHQIELEMQNEELRKSQQEIEEFRQKYTDLYDFAPLAYFTFAKRGMILEANLAGASLLNMARAKLPLYAFISFISPESRGTFHRHLRSVFSTGKKEICELKLMKKGGASFHVSLESIASNDNENHPIQCRSIITDITERKRVEEDLQKAHEKLRQSEERLQHLSARLIDAQEEERKRFAAEVHDSFSASLSAMKHRIQSIQSGNGSMNEQLEGLKGQVQALIEDSRRIQMALRPSILDDVGIVSALSWFTREFHKTYSHMKVTREIDLEENQIPKAIKTPLFRICQEAFTNAAKHSKAKSIKLSLGKKEGSLRLEIQDNGVGIAGREISEVSKERGRGLGLLSMEERASLSGGVFAIHSELGKGTTIRVSWALD